jgi:hypothetical protein
MIAEGSAHSANDLARLTLVPRVRLLIRVGGDEGLRRAQSSDSEAFGTVKILLRETLHC